MEYTRAWLLGQYVFLDLDDKTGKDPYGRWVAVVYLSDQSKPGKNFNKMLVDLIFRTNALNLQTFS